VNNAYNLLKERGFIEQTTHEHELKKLLTDKHVVFYTGFDPTADSLTVGHFLQVMAMSHMQKCGHIPIVLIGGGTCMVGDPTFKSEMRRLMPKEEINRNVSNFKHQLSKFIDFSDDKAILIDNSEWLCELNYINFIREYGTHFSVNRMLSADCYKNRLHSGLTFFEFNYMLMQAYDFLQLHKKYHCTLQLGGSDQWSNIIAGIDLIRKIEKEECYGLTFKLLTTSSGKKMGKTEKGAIWLDPSKTSPYEFFQYFRNIDDKDVKNLLYRLTYIPIEEIDELIKDNKDSKINNVKERLAFELTKIVHGEEHASETLSTAKAIFNQGSSGRSLSSTEIKKDMTPINIIDLLELSGLIKTKSEGRRLIEQGGIKINNNKIHDITKKIIPNDFKNDELIIQKGKKIHHRIIIL
jgi:tyrosyl-tRNA synthetase